MEENQNKINGTIHNTTDMHETSDIKLHGTNGTSDINLHGTSDKTDLHGLLKYMQYMGIVSDMSYHKEPS